MSNMKVLMNGIIKENPTFVLLLGMCPTLGTTSSALNGMSMGLATMFVLDLFQYGYFSLEEPDPRHGTYSGLYCRNRYIRNRGTDSVWKHSFRLFTPAWDCSSR